LEAYKHSASLANSEWGSIEGELLQERKGFLDSMVKHRELRQAHEVYMGSMLYCPLLHNYNLGGEIHPVAMIFELFSDFLLAVCRLFP
jgi:hypothetical protein